MSFWDWLWFCDNCGTSPGGSMPGMSVSINPRCPECQHHRCKFCTVEAVDTRKITEMPRERSSPLRPDPRPHPMMPTMSLALLQKIPAENSGSTVSQQKGLKIPVNLSHNSNRGHVYPSKRYPTSMDGPIYVTLSEISPPSSPPGLSPSSTGGSLCSSESSNSDVTSPTSTDPGSDTSTSVLEDFNHDELIECASESLTSLLDFRLMAVLGHDLELAARLIPRIHELIHWSFASECVAVRVVPSQGAGSTQQTTPASVSGSSPTASRTVRGTDSKHRKHKHNSEDEGEEKEGRRRSRGSKRPRKSWEPNSSRPRGFACPFYRKDPQKYTPTTNIKYRTCIGPGPTEFRRIKDHLFSSHRPSQCDRCYYIFQDNTQLTDHRRSEPPCTQKGIEIKEGIDDGQWQMIEELLKVKRGLGSSEKAKHDIEKWFELWNILFPDIPPPQHPWSDSDETKLAPATIHVAGLIDTFDRVIELDIERGNLQRDNYVHERYRLAVRQLLETAMAVSPQSPGSSPLPALHFSNGSRGLPGLSPDSAVSSNRLLPSTLSPHPACQSPTDLIRGYAIQDAGSQSWTPRSQMENSTPSVSTQNSLAAQWGTPQEFSTPATSSSQDTSAVRRDSPTVSSHIQSETLGYNLEETLSLPSQIEWGEEWEQFQNFESGTGTQQGSGIEPEITPTDSEQSEQNRPVEHPLSGNDTLDVFATNESLTAILELEIDFPTAGAPIKDHGDRNKGLQKLLYNE